MKIFWNSSPNPKALFDETFYWLIDVKVEIEYAVYDFSRRAEFYENFVNVFMRVCKLILYKQFQICTKLLCAEERKLNLILWNILLKLIIEENWFVTIKIINKVVGLFIYLLK